jgi:hypothetical protein
MIVWVVIPCLALAAAVAWRGPSAWRWWRFRSALLAAARSTGIAAHWRGLTRVDLIAKVGDRTMRLTPMSAGLWRDVRPRTWSVMIDPLGPLGRAPPAYFFYAKPRIGERDTPLASGDADFDADLFASPHMKDERQIENARALLASSDVRALLDAVIAGPDDRITITPDFIYGRVSRGDDDVAAQLELARTLVENVGALWTACREAGSRLGKL